MKDRKDHEDEKNYAEYLEVVIGVFLLLFTWLVMQRGLFALMSEVFGTPTTRNEIIIYNITSFISFLILEKTYSYFYKKFDAPIKIKIPFL